MKLLGPGTAPTTVPVGLLPDGNPSRLPHPPEALQAVLERLQDGLGLEDIAALPGYPDRRTLYLWKRENHDVAQAVTHAREIQAAQVVAQAQGLVDADLDLRLDGRVASAGVQRTAQQVGFRRWLAGCYDRPTYGDPTKDTTQVNVTLAVAFGRLMGKQPGE